MVHAGTLVPGQRITLTPEHARGLRFREVNPKEAFTLVDDAGRFFRASLTSLAEGGGEALVYEAMTQSPESPAHITLLCAVLARQRMLVVIQKATELGAVRVVPIISERSVQRAGLAHEKAHAWPGQALRAVRQCRRASVPEVRPAVTLGAALDDASFAGATRRFYLDDQGDDSKRAAGGGTPTPTEIAFAVGPEGGWTDAERALLRARGATGLRFGGRVLRAETAVLVGVAWLQAAFGDM
ncbi:MAG TPA: RsmE family RNA methyltransferase [Polyangiaceae bacterium]|jgi:16S rRNA (uracil1498-N3)-methyltransferase|nr:RsmE family RNA methyltransferase [Polyangiaceae bacterium]